MLLRTRTRGSGVSRVVHASWIVVSVMTFVVTSWVALSALLARGLGRRTSSATQRAWARLGRSGLCAVAASPLLALLALASLVVRARIATGEWPHAGPPRLDEWFFWVRDGFQASELPVHHAVLLWTSVVGLASPLLYPLVQSFLVGLGERVSSNQLVLWAGSWFACLFVCIADPGGFVDWVIPYRLWD